MTGSVRQALASRLRAGPVTVRDLARDLGLAERAVADHLAHVRRSTGRDERFVVEPARCLGCGFRFAKRDRTTPPGRCPRCRSERIAPAVFQIVPR